ncbi:MAG: aspartate-semialdehyde dehydrogenase [Bacteroidales bacterium]|jgi:aspartate-semialdehyde dehydrogenase|nr:aspartate-semialdehyde dehydrogenase [Bacteroidales bacterium]
MKIAIVGVTGMVGGAMLDVLEKSDIFRHCDLLPVASDKSVGKTITFHQKDYTVINATEAIRQKPEIAIFSAGAKTSEFLAPLFAEANCTVIDNSSYWRMFPEIPLIVPEINANILKPSHKIIANPNCSTIQLVMVMAPLHNRYHIKRVVVSTYQSVTGTGVKALQQLMNERVGNPADKVYPHVIDMNLFPHGGIFTDSGYTSEEIKLHSETQKILNDTNIQVTATVVRVPVKGGHSEAVNIEFEKEYELTDVISMLHDSPGLCIYDDPSNNIYPMPITAEGQDDVFVGRIRRDFSREKCLNLWITADNLRKGAATNAIQIAEYLVINNIL